MSNTLFSTTGDNTLGLLSKRETMIRQHIIYYVITLLELFNKFIYLGIERWTVEFLWHTKEQRIFTKCSKGCLKPKDEFSVYILLLFLFF